MSYQLLANLSNFYHIFWLSDMAIFSRVLPPDNFEPHNFRKLSESKAFVIILLVVNLSPNENLLIALIYER